LGAAQKSISFFCLLENFAFGALKLLSFTSLSLYNKATFCLFLLSGIYSILNVLKNVANLFAAIYCLVLQVCCFPLGLKIYFFSLSLAR